MYNSACECFKAYWTLVHLFYKNFIFNKIIKSYRKISSIVVNPPCHVAWIEFVHNTFTVHGSFFTLTHCHCHLATNKITQRVFDMNTNGKYVLHV